MASYPDMAEDNKNSDPEADVAGKESQPGQPGPSATLPAPPTRLATSVGKAIAWSQGLSLVKQVLSFVFSVVIVRSLAPQDYGLYAFLLSIIATAGIVVSLGFDGVIGRYVSKFHALAAPEQFSALVRELITWRFVLVMLASLILWWGNTVIADLLHNPDAAVYLQWIGILLIVQNMRLLLNTIQYAILNTRFAELIAVTERMIALSGSILLFNWWGKSLTSLLIALIIAECVALFLSFIPLVASLRGRPLSVRFLSERSVRSMALNYWGTDLVTYAFSAQLAILLISLLLSSNTEIAYYSIGTSLIAQISVVAVSSWKNLPLPVLSQARSRMGDTGVSSGWVLFSKLFILFLAPVMMFFLVSAIPLIFLLYGTNYALSAGVVQIYAFFFIVGLPSGAWATLGALYVLGAENRLFQLRVLTGGANLLLILLLVPLWGIWGAVIATSFAAMLSNWAEYFLLRRHLEAPIPWRFFATIAGISLISALASSIIPGIGWLTFGLRFALYGFCAILLALLFKPFDSQVIFQVTEINVSLGRILQFAGHR